MIIRRSLMALAIGAVAAFALAQNADKNTAGPTKNDYRLRVVEPVEGATVSGSSFQVVVNLNPPPQLGDSQKRDVNSMPRPRVDVFVDDENKGTLADTSNVLAIESVPAGAHKLVVVAKNLSGEIIDRKEINFQVETGATVATSRETSKAPAPMSSDTDRSSTMTAPAPAPPPAPAPNPDRSTTIEQNRSTYSAPPAPAPPVASSRNTASAPEPKTLPATASYDPLLAVGGLALLATGLALHRRS